MDYIFNQLKEGKIGKNGYLHHKYIRACERARRITAEKKGSAQERRQRYATAALELLIGGSVHALPPRI